MRELYKSIRNNIPDKKEKSMRITERVLGLDELKKAHNIAIFLSFGSEVETRDIINELLPTHVVAIPRVVGKDMVFLKINSLEGLEESRYGIMEPPLIFENIMNDVDFAIVPGLAFTEDGIRMGYGGGFYDKFFANSFATLCAICFDEQITKELPSEPHDRRMDIIISDARSIYIKKRDRLATVK